MPGIQVLEPAPNFGSQLGEALGGGLSQGLGEGLSSFFEHKKNSNSAASLADNFGLQGLQRENFVKTFKNIPAKEQLGALEKLAIAKTYMAHLEDQFGSNQGMGNGSSGQPEEDAAPFQQGDVQEQPTEQKSAVNTVRLGGFDFDRKELPKKTKRTPPFGPFAKQAEIEESGFKENRKEIAKYSEPYEKLSDLKANINKLQEAKNIIDKEDISGNTLRRAAIAIAEGHESPIAEMMKTPAQQKLFYLLRDALKPKDIGGSNPSTREVLIAMSAIPSYLKGKEANQYIINQMIAEASKTLKKGELITGLRKYDREMDPAVFKEIVEKKVGSIKGAQAEEEKIPMIDAQGKKYRIPTSMVEKAEKQGYKRA